MNDTFWGNAMAIKAGLILAGALLLAPAAVTAGQTWLADHDTLVRPVTLAGPIVGFRQTRDQIDVTLDAATVRPASASLRLVVGDPADPGGEPVRVALRRGQSFATASLPDHLAHAAALSVTVEQTQTLAHK